MAHNYRRDPPPFAKDPWAWDYTRDRIEQNTGIGYDDWEGKHFAGAAAMYKNVRRKYGDALKERGLSVPRECVDCGLNNVHYEGDYICQKCRDAIEESDSYYEAAETISRPDAMDAIRQQLADKLGHKPKPGHAAKEMPVDDKTSVAMENNAPAEVGRVSRNYGSMNPDKLLRSIRE